MEDYGVFALNEDDVRLALVPEDIQDAIDLPAEGWPSYQDLYGRDPPVPLLFEASQIAGLGGADPRSAQNRPAGKDIVPRALGAAGAMAYDDRER